MARRKKDEGPSFNPTGWMTTFSDLVTLLLTFFVMLLTMKQPEIPKLINAFAVFQEGGPGLLSSSEAPTGNRIQMLIKTLTRHRSKDLKPQEEELKKLIEELPGQGVPALTELADKGISLRSDQRGPVITLANDLLFAPGSATLTPQAKALVRRLAKILRPGMNPISVEGHTDNIPPGPGSKYVDNWDLSLARALAVLRELAAPGGVNPARLRAVAWGDTRPLVPNDTPAHRAKNRRTDIVLITQTL